MNSEIRPSVVVEAVEDEVVRVIEFALLDHADLIDNRELADAGIVAFDLELLVTAGRLLEIQLEQPDLPLVVVSAARGARAVRKALSGGARAYVYQQDLAVALWPAVQSAMAGQICVPADVRRSVARAPMSHREKQVLEHAARGFTNLQIAHELYLAESTVKTHLSTAFRKLGVRSRTEAASLVLDPEIRVELGLNEDTLPKSLFTTA